MKGYTAMNNDINSFSNTQAQPDNAENISAQAVPPPPISKTLPADVNSPPNSTPCPDNVTASNTSATSSANEPQHSTLTATDTVVSIICFALGFIFTHYVCEYAGGIWGGILWLLVGIVGAIYVTLKKVRISPLQGITFAVAEVFCFVPLVCSNGFINTLAAMFSFILLFYIAISLSGAELFGKHFIVDLFSSTFARPFASFGDSPRAVCRIFRQPNLGKNIGLAIVGLILAVPLTIVVVFLLMSSDQMFEDNMDKLWSWLPDFEFLTIFQLLMAVPIGMYLFGMMSSASKTHTPSYDDSIAPAMRVIAPALGYTMVTPVCIIYLLYIVTQFNYFTAAFGGSLPAEYSYSSYARRGFFELCVIAVINLCIIAAMQLFMKRNADDSRPAALKIYTTVISIFTMLLITSAISKMVLYINEMGMTPLRIYTSWFMILLAIIFVLIVVLQFANLPFWKAMFAAFSVMMGLLCFSNVDGIIADYNVTAYIDGRLEDVDFGVLEECGDAAIVHAARLVEDDNKYIASEARKLINYSDISVASDLPYFNINRVLGEAAAKKANVLIY